MTKTWSIVGGLLFAIAVGSPADAQTEPDTSPTPRQEAVIYRVAPISEEIVVDGDLDESAWQTATPIPVALEWSPGNNIEPPVTTMAYVMFDDKNIYVGFRCDDPEPKQIRANLMSRDQVQNLVKNDYVLVQFDTFDSQRRGFQFRVNPLGVQADAIFSEVDGREDFSWDMIWKSAGSITPFGYSVEIAFPLKQLRFPSGSGEQTWGIDLGRSYPRSFRHRINNAGRDRNNSCTICQWNKITGLQNVEPGRNIELDPTLTGARTDELDEFPDGELVDGDEDVQAGLTARWGVTPNITLLGTINPDFSQVEADAARLNVNNQFALFFEERRPFFLEGVDFFTTPLRAVFTRTVVDPDWGAKMTGKIQSNAVGMFAARDSVNSLIFPSNQGSDSTLLEESVTSGVARYRRDVGKSSTLGVLYTGREGDEYHNRVGGIDGFLRLSAKDTIDFQVLRSDTLYPEEVATDFDQPSDSFDGYGFVFDYDHDSNNWFWSAKYEDRDPELRLDSGFLPRVDIRDFQAFGLRKFWGQEEDWYSRIDLGGFVQRTDSHSGELTNEEIFGFFTINGPLQSEIELWAGMRKELFEGVLYDNLTGGNVRGEFQPNGSVELEVFVQYQEVIDYTNNQPADEFLISPEIEARIGRHINLSLDHVTQRLDVAAGELFTANLTELRAVYNFNVRLFVRAILQRFDIDRNPEFYLEPVEENSESFFTQFLLSYIVNPRTVFFAGYSENREGNQDVSLIQTNRTFFIKFGYAWIL